MSLADRLKKARTDKKLSQQQLAQNANVHYTNVGRYERGDIKPSSEVVVKIADAPEVSVDYLIGKTDLQLDKDAGQRLVDISKLPDDSENYVLGLIDMALKDFKAKKAYAS